MMKLIPCILFLFFAGAHLAHAQEIPGRVTTADHKPLPLVSVVLLRDSVFVAGAMTDEAGYFRLKTNCQTGVDYTIKFSLVGYEVQERSFAWPDTAFLSKLVLHRKDQLLGEVVVASKKPLVTRRADRYIVNVEDSYLANGNSGLEVLQRSPGIWVSPNGSIRIIGGQSVTVMINDVVQRMSGAELSDLLRSLRSEDISRIEVIANPPSEYEAASTGGIIHIILKRSRRDGLTATLNAQYRQQQNKPYTAAGASVDYKLQQWYVFGGYNYSKDMSRYTGWNNVLYPDQSNLYSDILRNNNITRHQFRAGLVYDISANHSINLQTMGLASRFVNDFETMLDYQLPAEQVTGHVQSAWRRKPWQGSYTFNYGWKMDTIGSSLRIIADYTTSSKTELNELLSFYSDTARNRFYHTLTPSTTHLTSMQADYTKALKKQAAIKTGIKYVHTDRDNTVLMENHENGQWIKNIVGSNEFRYTESLLMFYASYEKKIKRTDIKAGLRGEQTWAEGYSITIDQSIKRSYFGWFPAVFITQTLNEKKGNVLTLSYSRRVRRPGYNDLNPYRLQVHDFTVLAGNPNLLPQYTHSVRTAFTYRQNHTASLYLNASSNYMAQTAATVDSNIVEYRSKNYPNSREYGMSLETSAQVTKAWNARHSLLYYNLSAMIDERRYTLRSLVLQSIHTFTWKNVLDADLVMQYNSPFIQANTRYSQIFGADIGATRRLWKDKGRLRFFVADMFNTVREKELTEYDNTRIDFYQKRPTRTFTLAFSYTFKTGKAFTKKRIDQNNSEEKSRL